MLRDVIVTSSCLGNGERERPFLLPPLSSNHSLLPSILLQWQHKKLLVERQQCEQASAVADSLKYEPLGRNRIRHKERASPDRGDVFPWQHGIGLGRQPACCSI